MSTIILYTSKYGTTKECAEYLNKKISSSQIEDISKFHGKLEIFDQVIIGSPIYSGKFPMAVIEFLAKHEGTLLTKKYTIFYCGMSEQFFEKAIVKSVPESLRNDSSLIPVGGAYKLESIGLINRLLLRLTGVKESVNKVNYQALDKIAKTA